MNNVMRGKSYIYPVRLACLIGSIAISFYALSLQARDVYPRVERLLSTGKTILDQQFSYPTGAPAKVTSVFVLLKPGEETGWHEHKVPLFAYIIEGELTVNYGPNGKRVFRMGDRHIEAINAAHNGKNTGTGIVRILAVFMGAEGIPNTVSLKPQE